MDESFIAAEPNDNTHQGRFQADYEEVMEMMNAEQQLDLRLRLLRQQGTQWRELKPDPVDRPSKTASRRASREGQTPLHKPPALISTHEGSCDASSEESDHQLHVPTAQQLMSSSMVTGCGEPRSMSSSVCTAAGSLPEGSAWWSRKRRHLKGNAGEFSQPHTTAPW